MSRKGRTEAGGLVHPMVKTAWLCLGLAVKLPQQAHFSYFKHKWTQKTVVLLLRTSMHCSRPIYQLKEVSNCLSNWITHALRTTQCNHVCRKSRMYYRVSKFCIQGQCEHAKYDNTTKISQNLRNGNMKAFITIYRSSSSVIMTNNTTSGTKKRHKSSKPESHQMAKIFSFLLLLLSLLHTGQFKIS